MNEQAHVVGPESQPDPVLLRAPCRIGKVHARLVVRDLDRLSAFYEEVIGLPSSAALRPLIWA